jgi:hypothetical protein
MRSGFATLLSAAVTGNLIVDRQNLPDVIFSYSDLVLI